MIRTVQLPAFEREFDAEFVMIARAEDAAEEEPEKFEFTFSTETPCMRSPWMHPEGLYKPWLEVLGHTARECDLKRMKEGGALLVEHDTYLHAGAHEDAWIDEDKKIGRGIAYFSPTDVGQKALMEVKAKVKRKISTRYIPHKMKLIQRGDPEKGEMDSYRVIKWEVLENSLVAIPLDPNAKVDGGKRTVDERTFPVEIDDGEAVEEERSDMKPNGTPPAGDGGGTATVGHDYTQRNAEVAEITALCRQHEIAGDDMDGWIKQGLGVDQVARQILAKKRSAGPAQPAGETVLDLSRREVEQFSYARAIEGCLQLRGKEKGVFGGFEREVHDELFKHLPDGFDYHGGVLLPMRLGKRSMDSKTAGKGSELVAQQAGELIEYLRDDSLLFKLGARPLVGLTAKIPFPKQKGGMQFYWVAENPPADVADSDVTLGISWLDPKALAGMNIVSRQLLTLSLLDMDDLIRKEIAVGIALELDRAGIHGKGGEGVPLGVYKYPDITTKAMGGVPDYTKIVDMFAQIRKKNAHRGKLGFATTPEMAGKLMTTPEFTNAPKGIWTGTFDEGVVAGYRAVSSTQISATMSTLEDTGGSQHGMLAANFDDILIGTYGVVEVLADPYVLAGRAMVRMHAFFMADTLLRHGESVTAATGATLA